MIFTNYPKAVNVFKDYNRERLDRQFLCVKRWWQAGGSGVVEGVTGFGKTTVAWLAIIYLSKKLQKKLKVCIVTPTINLQQSWLEESIQLGIDAEILVIHTAIKKQIDCDLLICDEIHGYASDKFSLVFRKGFKYILGLTPLLKRTDGLEAVIQKYAKVVDRVSMEEALSREWINEYKVYNLRVEILDKDRKKLNELANLIDNNFSWFEHDLGLLTKFTKNNRFKKSYTETIGISPKILEGYAANFWRYVKLRKTLLLSADSKIRLCSELLNRFEKRKIITFLNTINDTKRLMKLYNIDAAIYHSKLNKYTRQQILEDFKSNRISRLFTIKALDEGFSDKKVSMAIDGAGTSNPKQFIQRLGRIVRTDHQKDSSIYVCLYFADSQEEKWLKSRQKYIPKRKILNVNYDEFINQTQLLV